MSRTEQQQVVERFLAALTTGDVEGLLDVLAPDVVVVGDGGGLAPTIPRPISGAWRVANALSRIAQHAPGISSVMVPINGTLGARLDPSGELETALTFTIEDGRITRILAIRNPHKLGRLDEVAEVRR